MPKTCTEHDHDHVLVMSISCYRYITFIVHCRQRLSLAALLTILFLYHAQLLEPIYRNMQNRPKFIKFHVNILLSAFVSDWQELSTMPFGAICHAAGCMLHSWWLPIRNRFIFPHSRHVTVVCERFLPTKQTKSCSVYCVHHTSIITHPSVCWWFGMRNQNNFSIWWITLCPPQKRHQTLRLLNLNQFLLWDAMLSRVYAVVVCLSVRLSVCVAVYHTPVLYQNG